MNGSGEMLRLCERRPIQSISLVAGQLGVIEGVFPVPFEMKRLYFLSGVPEGHDRGAHAHKELSQFFVALTGSFTLTLDSGEFRETVELNSSTDGILIGPGLWRDLSNFSPDAVCLVIASHEYSEADYIRNFDDFKSWVTK